MWRAVWFTDPELLFPLVARNLAPGGIFAFSQTEPSPGAYGPQPVHGRWLEGRESELTVLRWQYTPRCGRTSSSRTASPTSTPASCPQPDLGTLLVRAQGPI
ncbi:hypothetical protein AB0G48_18590 [Streptomyces rubiginosohelvolus]|uniref:hypothetical protein n=1 Tax=Streptomyces rubiginosohelvolus TaxID=67362 RepID=UPI0033CED8A1